MMKNFLSTIGLLVFVFFVGGCNSTFMPPADPNMSDLTPEQSQEICKRKIHVPCAVEIHCEDGFVGQRDSAFFTNYYHYPLKSILTNSMKNATYQVFDPAGGEVIDAFTMHVTVSESNLDVAWGKANYRLQIIVKLNEPGEKKVMTVSVNKTLQEPFPDENKIPDVIYKACRDASFEAMQQILKNPKLWTTVKRFEDK